MNFMVLSQDPPFLFLHIPKTAGSSIEEALFHYQSFDYFTITHGCALQYKDWLDDDFYFSLFKFAFIRNPWDLQVSCYRYYVLGHGIDMTFDEYIDWKFNGSISHMVDRLPKDVPDVSIDWLSQSFYVHRTPQTYFLIDEKGKFIVDYIASFERLTEHFDIITKKLKLEDVYLPHLNNSNSFGLSEDYRDYYTKETEELIRSRYSLDIKMFGYDFKKGFADREIMGFVDNNNDTIQKRGYLTPTDFYFPQGSLPYGLSNIRFRYENQSEDSLTEQKKNFQMNKNNRRIGSLQKNIQNIEETLHFMESQILENPEDFVMFNSMKPEIQKLFEKSLIYKMEIKKLEVSNLQLTN